eukprot:CCRYP_008456-RA/>CCRYP_008456-RA protein AED:0.28 eAED:0.28 QI:0/0.75/0.6/1/0.5/0.4/5/3125/71
MSVRPATRLHAISVSEIANHENDCVYDLQALLGNTLSGLVDPNDVPVSYVLPSDFVKTIKHSFAAKCRFGA